MTSDTYTEDDSQLKVEKHLLSKRMMNAIFPINEFSVQMLNNIVASRRIYRLNNLLNNVQRYRKQGVNIVGIMNDTTSISDILDEEILYHGHPTPLFRTRDEIHHSFILFLDKDFMFKMKLTGMQIYVFTEEDFTILNKIA